MDTHCQGEEVAFLTLGYRGSDPEEPLTGVAVREVVREVEVWTQ